MREPKKFRTDRPVDRYRNSGGHAQVEGEIGNIVSMFTFRDERVFFICERGIGSAQMADQIDPERLNPALPKVIQKTELRYGISTPFVGRTVCIANEIFQQIYLPESVTRDFGLALALDALWALAEVQDNIEALAASEAEVRRQIDARELKAHVVPTTKNYRNLSHGSVGSLREVAVVAQKLAEAFYPKAKPNDPFSEHLRGTLQAQLKADDPAFEHVEWCLRQIERFAAYRNALIHADKEKHLMARDYTIEPSGRLIAPTIEVLHPNHSLPRMDIVQFLKEGVESMSLVFETFTALFADRNVRHLPHMRSGVVEEKESLPTGTRFHWQSYWLGDFPEAQVEPEAMPEAQVE